MFRIFYIFRAKSSLLPVSGLQQFVTKFIFKGQSGKSIIFVLEDYAGVLDLGIKIGLAR